MHPGEGHEAVGPVNQLTALDVKNDVHDTTLAALDTRASNAAAATLGVEELARTFEAVVANVRSAYLGRDLTVRLSLCCLMAEGHLLVEDHPGVGKTTLAKALARSLGLGFGRIQLTADLLPADVTGAVVFDRDTGLLAFRPGPVFTNVLLADELNRASPKAQSALLEAMEERQVSADGISHPLPRPFMVIATQNPFDAAGTFPLPHSQRDRFLLRLDLGYPDRETEDLLLSSTTTRPNPEELAPVGSPEFLAAFASAIDATFVAPEVRGYVLDIVHATRNHPDLIVGASPRAALSVVRAAAAAAVTRARTYVTPDDVKLVAEPTLAHRLQAHPAAELAGATASATVADILSRIPVPVGAAR
jgi:MoxR-like ATPase